MGTSHRLPLLALAPLALACAPPSPVDAGDQDAGAPLVDAGGDAGPLGSILVVTPTACDFGLVPVNTFALCEVTLANTGDRDVAIDAVRFSDDTPLAMDPMGNFDTSLPGFGSQTIVFLPFFMGPGTETTLRLFARPPTVGTVSGALVIAHGDDVHEVALKVTGDAAAHAVARVASVNGENTGPFFIRPLDDVLLSADESIASVNGGHITLFEWWLAEKPATSSVELTSPTAMTTRFHFNSSGSTRSGVDVAGTYRIGLRVTDAAGLVDEDEVELVARFDVGLAVELTWDSPNSDLDLHMTKGGGPWCSQQSCYYANCNASSAFVTAPEWDGAQGESAGDPRLQIDDLSGYGPEQIVIDALVDDVYAIGVHVYSFSISEPTVAMLRVFVDGALAFDYGRVMEHGRDFWEVTELIVEDGDVSYFLVDVVSPDGPCP